MKYLWFDIRALSLMRICIAIVILLDLGVRLGDLEAFYADSGAVPRSMLFDHAWNDYFISLHAISGLWQFQLLLFLMAIFFAAMLLIGYRTQLFTILSWFLLLSLHNRNGLILQGGDDLLRMVLFWGIFIPWGARYSCDYILSFTKYEPKIICTVACLAYLLQICYIYSGSALLKGNEWHTDLTAMYYVYGLDQVVYPITKNLFFYPELLKKLTFIAYYFELLVPLLFFVPIKHQLFRTLGVAFVILFHTFNGVTLFIGMFPLIGIATCLGLLPENAMNKFEKLTVGLKKYTRESFFNISKILQNVIRWKAPAYKKNKWTENLKNGVLIFLLLFVFDWNFSNLTFIKSKLSESLHPLAYTLRLDQNWGMFAPGVFKDDGWYILEGVTEENKNLNLFENGKKIDYNKPDNIISLYKNDRWRKYTENMILTYNSFMRGYFCNYYKRIWNEKPSADKIKLLRIIYMSEFTLPDYRYSKPSREILWECE